MIDPNAADVLRGWFAIAAELKVSETTARSLSQWGRECRCPVFEDHRGVLARRSELERWMTDQMLPVGVRQRYRQMQFRKAALRRLKGGAEPHPKAGARAPDLASAKKPAPSTTKPRRA